jgi:hypothetical protein
MNLDHLKDREEEGVFSQPLTDPVETKKKKTGSDMTLLTIILLIVLPPVGLIVMWVGTSWKTWVRALITGVAILIVIARIGLSILALTGTTSADTSAPGEAPSRSLVMGPRARSNDAQRMSHMRMFATAQDIHFSEDGAYLTSTRMPTLEQWDPYMKVEKTDPGERAYTWVDNTSDDQTFCIYASLEQGLWYAATPDGYYACDAKTPTLDDCCASSGIQDF